MSMKILLRFLKVPGILITGAILYIASKLMMDYLLDEVVGVAGADITQWHPIARYLIPLLPAIFLMLVIWKGFLTISRGDSSERTRDQGYGYPPQSNYEDDDD